ncbi:recombinase family protein [Sinisalibacter aestuarii]|nr:recombinase family protein [Sinisalibacter aestuarii]
MAELLAYRDHFGGLRQRGLLSKLTDIELELLRNGVIGARYSNRAARQRHRLSEEERRAQTENATHASRIARGNAADKKARELYAVRDVLTEVHEKPTLKMIADEANHRGLTTTRGGPWSSSTVGRTLKRLEETTQTESTTHDETQEER